MCDYTHDKWNRSLHTTRGHRGRGGGTVASSESVWRLSVMRHYRHDKWSRSYCMYLLWCLRMSYCIYFLWCLRQVECVMVEYVILYILPVASLQTRQVWYVMSPWHTPLVVSVVTHYTVILYVLAVWVMSYINTSCGVSEKSGWGPSVMCVHLCVTVCICVLLCICYVSCVCTCLLPYSLTLLSPTSHPQDQVLCVCRHIVFLSCLCVSTVWLYCL